MIMQPFIDEEQMGTASSDKCPVDHAMFSGQKTARVAEPENAPIECDAEGVWHVRGFAEARAVLRSNYTRQAGFNADSMSGVPGLMNRPMLYQDGKVHDMQRKLTARFFAPKTVSANYQRLMERQADQLVAALRRKKRIDLSQLTLTMAVRVASEVIGLTNSRLPGMGKRLDAFFSLHSYITVPQRILARLYGVRMRVLAFFLLDVKPAIQARKRQPQEDIISHLLAQGYNDSDILTECLTFAAAGMVTTREFISAAAWHFLEHPALRQRYLVASETERYALLEEVLRLEPVIGNILRQATANIPIESNGQQFVIPEGARINVHVHGTNADEAIVGEQPLALCPGRVLNDSRATPSVMGFGDGHHRCIGSYLAIQETDIFLQRLLALDSLQIERQPSLTWDEMVTGYEIRNFVVSVK
jgi:cytochrome P450